MGQWVLWLDSIKHGDLPTVGGKGANLGEMYGAGMPVPLAFCVTTEAYRHQFLNSEFQTQLDALRDAHKDDLDGMSSAIAALFSATPIDDDIRAAVFEAYDKLGDEVRVAVRSSATAEDLPDASFAGQQETFLGVLGKEALAEAVRDCWASLWSARAIHYREEQGFAHEIVALSVVVQEMVDAEIAGVMFTANPISLAADEIVITASFGLGESVVSGLVTPDTYTLTKEPCAILDKVIANKELQVIQVEQGSEEVAVPVERRQQPALSDQQVLQIAAMGCDVEAHYGSPQDIEWAVVGSQIYLLQTRPITTLHSAGSDIDLPSLDDHVYGWIDYGRIPKLLHKKLIPAVVHEMLLDHFPEPLRPFDLDASLAPIYSQLTNSFRMIGLSVPKKLIVEHPSGLMLFRFPFPNLFTLLWRWPIILWNLAMTPDYEPLQEWTEVDLPDFQARIAPLDEAIESVQGAAIIDLIRARMETLQITMFQRFYKYFKSGSLSHKRLIKSLRSINPDEVDALEHKLTLGLSYQTAVMNAAIRKLARIAHSTPSVQTVLQNAVHGSQFRALEDHEASQEFLSAFAEFMREHGSRAAVGMEPMPSYPSWNDVPENVLSMVSVILNDPEAYADKWDEHTRIYEKTKAEVMSQLRSARKIKIFEESLSTYRGFWIAREATLHLFEEQVEVMRSLIRRLAKDIVASNLLSDETDVYYLTREELRSLVTTEDKSEQDSLRELAVHRKTVWTAMKESMRGLSKPSSNSSAEASVYLGTGASPGCVTGKVCVVSGAQEFGKLSPGDVLVCASTSPAWTPLFSIASAVITDTGGLLSHAAIVAREYNIPAVMGCMGATHHLKDGWLVEVNGNTGEIHRI